MSESRRVQVVIRGRVLCEKCRSPDVKSKGMSRGRSIHYYRCADCDHDFEVMIIRIDSSFTTSEQVSGADESGPLESR